MSPLVFIAAERMEFAGLLRRAKARRLDLGIDFAAEVELLDRRWILAANGAGPDRAAEAALAGIRFCKPDAVISTGYCGALDPVLKVGEIFCATSIDAIENGIRYTLRLPGTLKSFSSGVLVSQNRVAQTIEEKAALFGKGFRAVEMEASGAARMASEFHLPVSCVRVVTDLAEESFRIDWNACRRDDGRFSRNRVVVRALSRPATLLPELLRMACRARQAGEALGEFLVDCRF